MIMDLQSKDIAAPPTNFTAEDNSAEPSHPMKRRHLIAIIGLILIIGIATAGIYFFLQSTKTSSTIRTYFTYSQADTAALRDNPSSAIMSIQEVQKWEDRAYELVESHGSADVDASKIYAYLATAQMDAAALSFKAHGEFRGDIGPISKEVLCAFYPDSCSELMTNNDPYSKALSDIVMVKVTERRAADAAQTKPVTLKAGSGYWQGPAPQTGLSAPSFKPWFMARGDQFRLPPPIDSSSTIIKQQLVQLKSALASASNEQKAIVVKWAGGPGTRTPPGIWLTLAADYMHAKGTPLDTYLEVRALTAASMADAVIAAFDSKYAYQYKRPNMLDPSIITIMPTPNHPSYPAGHATISWAAATVLSTYLPENKQEWEKQAQEASDSRTIGGIHFPQDNTAGTTLGIKVGDEVIKKWGSQ